MEALRSIGVVGGGSAGYISALYLKNSFPEARVTLIESASIPVLGVGEATTPLFRDFLHRKMGFRLQEFFQQAQPTFKLGVRFNWGLPDDYHYNNPFGNTDITNALYHSNTFNNLSFTSLLMEAKSAPFVVNGNGMKPLKLSRGYAYQVDNKHFLSFMRSKLQATGCECVTTDIEQVVLDADRTSVAKLVAKDGAEFNFDLYIDCSGFRSLLLEKAMGAGWVDFSSSLKTNRAIIGTRPNTGVVRPYTTSSTMKHGWLWDIPMKDEDHLGYVFSSEHCTDEEAFAELKQHCREVNDGRVIKFKPGRHDASWKGNVVGVGNAFAFIEPLESTGLHMILKQLRALDHGLRSHNDESAARAAYNAHTNDLWESLRYYIALHFKNNAQLDTEFWRMCREETNISGLDEYLAYYESKGPLSFDKTCELHAKMSKEATFTVYSYDATMAGCGLGCDAFRNDAQRLDLEWPRRFAMEKLLVEQCVGHREALRYVEENDLEFEPAPEVVA